ncbi:unnamed protein product [Cunninghamella echinulata]
MSTILSSSSTRIYQPLLSKSLITKKKTMPVAKYSYRACPLCSERLLVRIHGTLVYKWINLHFSTKHHESLHIVVNLHEGY